MTKVQKADPDLPSRSDSFLRMLELEKRYKMQRIQGHAPPTITSPSTSSPSAQPNHPFKARRASGHPPLSHTTQIMKAVRRNSALPSLSISIPPSPTEGPAVGADGLLGAPQSKNGERTKTVTFSGHGDDKHEDEDEGAASDQSSICQSPSWEQYGRKKQKKPKKRDVEQQQDKKSKEKSANTLTRKGNRLSKVPPPHVKGVDVLAATDRSRSAPELAMYLKSNTGNLDTPKPTPPITMANQKANGKPKSKGFLSNFRLQHGNVAAAQKIADAQRGSIDANSAPASPMFSPHPAVEPNFTNPRKPPSIISNSTRSISSLDQLPTTRHSSNSSHGRSQSLLSSTLSKLKGPSYLYFRPSENTDQRPVSSQGQEVIPNWSNGQQPMRQPERKQESPEAQLMPPREQQQQQQQQQQNLPQFSFPTQPRQPPVQPTANIAARRVQNQSHFVESIDINNGPESVEPTSFRNRHAQMPPPRAPNRESGEREIRARSDRAPRASRQQVQQAELSWNEENRAPPPRQPNRTYERQYHPIRQTNGYVQPRVESWEESKHGPELSDDSDPNDDRLNQRQVNFDGEEEEDRVSVGTHASTIRPHSRRQANSPPETNGRKHVTFPPSPNGIGTAVTSDAFEMEAPAAVMESPQPKEPARKEEAIRTEKPSRSADYFSFISQAYSPPTLELRSPPLDGKFPSPRIDEEPEEDDDDLDHVLRHMAIRGQVNEVSSPSEIVNQAAASHTNATSRATRQKPAKNSPSMSSHYSDSDVPAFERLGLSPKAARILAGVEISSTSTNTDPSQSTSERSSSSTCDDNPSTPDSSRPQSRKGDNTAIIPSTHNCARSYCGVNCELTTMAKSNQPQVVAPTTKQSSGSTNGDANIQDDSWSRTALPIDLENQPTEPSNKPSSQTPTPPLVATPTSVTFADDVQENFDAKKNIDAKEIIDAEEIIERHPYQRPIPPRAQSALELHSATFDPGLKNPPLYAKKAKAGISSISLPNSPPSEPADATATAPRKSALRMSRKNSEEPSSALVSPGAAYLQEARRAAQLGTPPPPAAPPQLSSRALRPHYAHKNSSTSIKSITGGAEPLAKMLVECCSCKFFHDMPSRVYECMAKPDSLVEDKLLGVSATVTTMVRCPWCAHGMTTRCCAGYAAVVYLKEKLHGK